MLSCRHASMSAENIAIDAEFDAVAADYEAQHAASIRLSGESTEFFAEYKVNDVRDILTRLREAPATILDFGAGIGNSAASWAKLFPNTRIICADVSVRSLEICQERHGDKIETLAIMDGSLALDDHAVDTAFAACVFHHIDADQHVRMLRELRRVLRRQGNFFLFEHNPWNPLTRRAVANCPFDEFAVLISAPEMRRRLEQAGFRDIATRYRIFLPGPFAKLRWIERFLTWLPIGAQYSLHARA